MAVMRPDKASAESGWESIEELFEALESPLLAYALRFVGERSAAEDLDQEAFMRLHAHVEEVREPRKWLYRTVHNLALNHKRDNAKIISLNGDAGEKSSAATEASDPQPLPDEQIARMEGIGLVRLSV